MSTIREAALALLAELDRCSFYGPADAAREAAAALRSALDAAPSWSGLAEAMEARARDDEDAAHSPAVSVAAANAGGRYYAYLDCARMVREAGLGESDLLAACEAWLRAGDAVAAESARMGEPLGHYDDCDEPECVCCAEESARAAVRAAIAKARQQP